MGKYDTLYKDISTSNAQEMLKQIQGELRSIQESDYNLSRREDYCVKGHEGDFDCAGYMEAKRKTKEEEKPFRKEEWMCKRCMGKRFSQIGEVVDYQVPLKHARGDDCKGMGKVDLLSVEGETAWLLELKVPDSTEHPLRAIMEVYTYWKQLGGERCERFLEHSRAKGARILKKAIVIFEKGKDDSPKYFYRKLEKDWGPLSKLMEDLDVACFVARLKTDDPECDEIVEVRPCKL